MDAWLSAFIVDEGGVAGSVHHVREGALRLTGAFRLPEPVIRATAIIPQGKGMAGLAWERDAAVQTCNLQDPGAAGADSVKPGARAVNAQGAVAFPVHDGDGAVRAVVGIAYADERVLDATSLEGLARRASTLP